MAIQPQFGVSSCHLGVLFMIDRYVFSTTCCSSRPHLDVLNVLWLVRIVCKTLKRQASLCQHRTKQLPSTMPSTHVLDLQEP